MFTIAGEQYNEYEIRQLQISVAEGLQFDSEIMDVAGNVATIDNQGRLSNTLVGFDLSHLQSIRLFLINGTYNGN